MEINILELSEYVLFIQLDPCYVWKGGMMGILPWVMVGGKNWSAGDGGRQKLVRGRWRAEKIGPRAGPTRRVMPSPPPFLRLSGGPFHVIEAESINGFRIPAYF